MKVHIDKDRERKWRDKNRRVGRDVESTNKGWTEGERKTKVGVFKKQLHKDGEGLVDLLRLYRHYWIQHRINTCKKEIGTNTGEQAVPLFLNPQLQQEMCLVVLIAQ